MKNCKNCEYFKTDKNYCKILKNEIISVYCCHNFKARTRAKEMHARTHYVMLKHYTLK